MKISARLFELILGEKYPFEYMGKHSRQSNLALPVFFERGTIPKEGKVYIVRTQELPETSRVDCIYVCVGSRPTQSWKNWMGEVLYITDREIGLFSLFNFFVEKFDLLRSWSDQMDSLMKKNEDLEEYVKCSVPVLGNAITITDYNLRILCNCEVMDSFGSKKVILSKKFSRVPDEISLEFRQIHKNRAQLREPYEYKGQRLNPEGMNYCINMYLGDSYVGTCTLWDALKPITESDKLLFQEFVSVIQRVLSAQTKTAQDQLATMKAIFSDLLHSYPVSEESLRWALDLLFSNMELRGASVGCWVCLVIRSANSDKTLPKEYLCTAIENMLPYTTVLDYEDDIVCYCAIPEGEDCESTVLDILLPYLKDMNFRVGVSRVFIDLYRAREYYLQALAMLRIGRKVNVKEYIYCFEDYILYYMLEHALGEFEYSLIESVQIQELKNMGTTVDYWDTLRRYLDNECNASKTAQELFLHRSSLLPRLDKIRTVVDFDTPEQRLYLRLCMYLSDLLEKK